ncbi:hypothetical protein [Bradyrhizobium elkanii]|jgi:hypothetical protein|nr:hypothetical protein [Bradyrhizobium elkanii]MCP1975656.1 hypothetical protein [Bradyrhizobium elkanii]MCS3482420.1 hypothetical protein [Bradyrhizobium elkanii]MCS3525200.1 hypothetical protein [Bradyrhizobium elkanii]MCS4075897.1 hypothetical protein [Bradyrhizobium elkanii]MCS4085163.1 hypothetical protein [Bradyrhizobium elkanii]
MVGRLAGRADALPHHQHKTLAKQLIKLINIVSHNIDYGIYSYFPNVRNRWLIFNRPTFHTPASEMMSNPCSTARRNTMTSYTTN